MTVAIDLTGQVAFVTGSTRGIGRGAFEKGQAAGHIMNSSTWAAGSP